MAGLLNRCESVGYATSAEAGGADRPRRRLRGAAVQLNPFARILLQKSPVPPFPCRSEWRFPLQ